MIQDDNSHDTLQRRRRDRRAPTGKRLTLQERDLLWLQKIHDHGPLSSSFLHAFSAKLRRNEKRARDRLTDLFNEDGTPHGGAYLGRPWQQFQTFDARYQDLVYDLTPAAETALKANGHWSDHAASGAGPWVHRYMVASISASIELATLDDPTVTYIPQQSDPGTGRRGLAISCALRESDDEEDRDQGSDPGRRLRPGIPDGGRDAPIASLSSRLIAPPSRHDRASSIARATFGPSCSIALMSVRASTRRISI